MSRQVLFVDDEAKVLEALKRSLRGMRREWSMEFASDPREALERLRGQEFDALVTDMRMPQMDGAELLGKARELRPGMARIVLSGYAEREAALRSVGLAHQFLAKPCSVDMLSATVTRACKLRELLAERSLAETVCQLGALPSLPKLYDAITDEIGRPVVSLDRVVRIIGRDIAMTAKILQLANSAFFGLGRRVLDIEHAVHYLGVDIIRALVVSSAAFSAFEVEGIEFFERVSGHSSLTGLLARRIAEMESGDPLLLGESFQAGMLHDIGQLVLASRLPDAYRNVDAFAGTQFESTMVRESRAVGCDHGRVGAYLMGLWGLSDRIVEALAYHHSPGDCSFRQWSPLTAVHAANAFIHEQLGTPGTGAELDLVYLRSLGCERRVDQWRREAQNFVDDYDGAR